MTGQPRPQARALSLSRGGHAAQAGQPSCSRHSCWQSQTCWAPGGHACPFLLGVYLSHVLPRQHPTLHSSHCLRGRKINLHFWLRNTSLLSQHPFPRPSHPSPPLPLAPGNRDISTHTPHRKSKRSLRLCLDPNQESHPSSWQTCSSPGFPLRTPSNSRNPPLFYIRVYRKHLNLPWTTQPHGMKPKPTGPASGWRLRFPPSKG